MLMMKNPVIMATCLLLLSSLAFEAYAASFTPDECCFKFTPKLQKRRVVSFKYTDSLCPMEGVVLKMKNGKEFCADSTRQWVKEIIKDKKNSQSRSTSTPSQ